MAWLAAAVFGLATFAELVALLAVASSAVLVVYMISASYARRRIAAPRTVRYANCGTVVMARHRRGGGGALVVSGGRE